MQVIWTPHAQADLVAIRAYVGEADADAANRLIRTLVNSGSALVDFPDRGRASGLESIRELVVSGTPYLLVYRVVTEEVQILRVWHEAQARTQDRAA